MLKVDRRLPEDGDVVVVGAGVVGSTIAYEFSRLGHRVVVVESGAKAPSGCSYANASLISPAHVTPLATPKLVREAARQMLRSPAAVKVSLGPSTLAWLAQLLGSVVKNRSQGGAELMETLAYRSAELHRNYAEMGLSPSYSPTSSVDAYLVRAPARQRGAEMLDQQELRSIEPALGAIAGGSLSQGSEAMVESRSYVSSMLRAAENAGASIHCGSAAVAILRENGNVAGVVTRHGAVKSTKVVLAAGLGSAALGAQAGVSLPLRGGRGYVVDLEPASGDPSLPVRFKDYRVVVTPLSDRLRISGYMEFGREDRRPDFRRVQRLLEVAAKGLPNAAGRRILDVWWGERPCSRDGLPIVGEARLLSGLVVATGHGMWGLILAPVSAELALEAVLDPSSITSPLLSPNRFA